MKALITAGGRGTRLRPITHTQNKHLIPIANKPILRYAIDAVRESGIVDIGIVVGVDNGHEVGRAFGNGASLGVNLTYIWQEAPLGLAHVVKISEEFIDGSPFVFYLGDNIVVDVQEELARRGYDPGVIDGIAGPQTRDAIVAFQRDNGLAITGRVDQTLLDELGV